MEWYDNIYDIGLPIDLRQWKKKAQIVKELREKGIKASNDAREFRRHVEKYNEGFYEHQQSTYIAHSTSKGYIVTQDKGIIMKALEDYGKRSFNQLRKRAKGMKAIDENYNLRVDLERESLW